jgi:hypothetical protein
MTDGKIDAQAVPVLLVVSFSNVRGKTQIILRTKCIRDGIENGVQIHTPTLGFTHYTL